MLNVGDVNSIDLNQFVPNLDFAVTVGGASLSHFGYVNRVITFDELFLAFSAGNGKTQGSIHIFI